MLYYAEKFTGTKKNRPEINRLLSEIGLRETLIFTKLSLICMECKKLSSFLIMTAKLFLVDINFYTNNRRRILVDYDYADC